MPIFAQQTPFNPVSRLSLFWQLQLIGWSSLVVVTLPIKQAAVGSLGDAMIFSAYQLPLSLALSAGLRRFYQWSQAVTRRPVRFTLLVLAGALAAGLLDCLVSVSLNELLGIRPQTPLVAAGMYVFRPAFYLIWSLAYFLIKTVQAAREQTFQAAIKEERHRFELLRYQLNPGFLAKSLTAISHEISDNPAAAFGMTASLAAFYQHTLRRTDLGQPTTIGDELALVRTYLEIETLRMRGALKVTYAVDESLLSLQLPPIILLPLAEQAIKAGGTPADPLAITVTAERTAEGLVLLEVANSGSLMPAGPKAEVSDVRARLDHHYPGVHRYTLRQDSYTTRATIYLPLLPA